MSAKMSYVWKKKNDNIMPIRDCSSQVSFSFHHTVVSSGTRLDWGLLVAVLNSASNSRIQVSLPHFPVHHDLPSDPIKPAALIMSPHQR